MSRFLHSNPQFVFFAFVFLQIGLVVALAQLFHLAFRRKASQQHFIWLSAITAVAIAVPVQLAMPALTFDLPQMANSSSIPSPPLVKNLNQSNTAASNHPVLISSRSPIRNSPDIPSEFSKATEPAVVPLLIAPESPQASTASLTHPANVRQKLNGWFIATLVYFLVVGCLLVRYFMGWIALRLVKPIPLRRCESIELSAQVAAKLRLSKPPRLGISKSIYAPMAYGVVRPTVLLPVEFESWSDSRQRMVLLHELSHVARRDAIWDLLSSVVAMLYWFHPAVIYAKYCLRRTRETATDMTVLNHGIGATDYARELLDIAVATPRFSAGIPMASQYDLKSRIKKVLAGKQAAPSWTTSVAFRLIILTLFVAVVGTSLKLTWAQENQTPKPTKVLSVNASAKLEPGIQESKIENTPTEEQVAKKESQKPQDKITGSTFFERVNQVDPLPVRGEPQKIKIDGIVRDGDGKPVAGAVVVLRNSAAMSTATNHSINDIFAKTKTDAEGRYLLDVAIGKAKWPNRQIVAFAKSGEMGWVSVSFRSKLVHPNVNVKLHPSEKLHGRIVDEKNKPVAGCTVSLYYCRRELANGGGSYAGFSDRMISPEVTTNQDGRFELPQVPTGFVVAVIIEHPDFAVDFQQFQIPRIPETETLGLPGDRKLIKNGSQITLERGRALRGKIVDSDGNPLSDVGVLFFKRTVRTNEKGEFLLHCKSEFVTQRKLIDLRILTSKFGNLVRRIPTDEFDQKQAVITLEKPGLLQGTVIDQKSRQPIANVPINISTKYAGFRARTDQDGKFSKAIGPGEVKISLYDPPVGYRISGAEPGKDWDGLKLTLKTGESKTLRPIELERMKPIQVMAVDSNNQPVLNAQISLLRIEPERGYYRTASVAQSASTGADGRAEIQRDLKMVSGSLVTGRAKVNGKWLLGEAIANLDGQETRLVLRPATKLSGIVSVDGKPIPDCRIRVTSSHGTKPVRKGRITVFQSISHPMGEAKTNDKGEYSLDVPATNYSGAPAEYQISVASGVPNKDASDILVRVLPVDNEYRKDIQFFSGDGVIAGLVVDSKGKPIPGVKVKIQGSRFPPGANVITPARFYQPASVFTDSNGEFNFKGLPLKGRLHIDTFRPDKYRSTKYRDLFKSGQQIEVGNQSVKIKLLVDQSTLD